MMTKEGLHQLVDALPESELHKAARLLTTLGPTDPVRRALPLAPENDEPETDEECAAVDAAHETARRGEVFPVEDVEKKPPKRLEDYFAFLAPDDIRISGTRIGIETVLYEYIHRGQTPEQIAERFDALTLEQVYATILYYLRNRDSVSSYLTAWLDYGERARTLQAKDPAFQRLQERLRQARAARAGHTPIDVAPK
jgi:uncharacterized protein (DUF433 family)